MTVPLKAMQDLRQGLMALLRELQSVEKPPNTRRFMARAEHIAALKIEIADLELQIIVAGGRLF